ncbi:hypothetical protein SscP1EGY_49 [Streptomyces phage SscP1EGY]|nr:hypothetical protein SscP1EGY_49 [Streptomyces phage SscP1EGY]
MIYLTALDVVLTAVLIGLGAGIMGAVWALIIMGLLFLLVMI